VEARLKAGKVSCGIATSSLELGIDIGSVQEVLLAGTPQSLSSTLQRIGRAGHRVGLPSRATLVPISEIDLLQAVALCLALPDALKQQKIEEPAPIRNPLDILAQLILSLCVEKTWKAGDLFQTLRGFKVFQTLERGAFTATLEMLSTIRPHRTGLPLLYIEGSPETDEASLSANRGAASALYLNGGVIASRGYYSMRMEGAAEGEVRIGELDEEFVWERRVGDTFQFGASSWSISRISSEAVYVKPLGQQSAFTPFYRAMTPSRSALLNEAILAVLGGARPENSGMTHLHRGAEVALENLLQRQRDAQGKTALSGKNFIAIEVSHPRQQGLLLIFHTFLGKSINFPLFLALRSLFEAEFSGLTLEGQADNNGILLNLPNLMESEAENLVDKLLRGLCRDRAAVLTRILSYLPASSLFAAAFREAAEHSLLLLRAGFNKRTPLWLLRKRANELFQSLAPDRRFPVTEEAARTCLNDNLDIDGFKRLLDDMSDGLIRYGFFHSLSPSPFSQGLIWANTNDLLYRGDQLSGKIPETGQTLSALLPDIPQEMHFDEALLSGFTAKLRRETPDYAPDSVQELCAWVKERAFIPLNEWEKLAAATPLATENVMQSTDRILQYYYNCSTECGKAASPPSGLIPSGVIHRDRLAEWERPDKRLLLDWLRYEGPLSLAAMAEMLPIEQTVLGTLLDELVKEGKLWCQAPLFCLSENAELLVRLQRREKRQNTEVELLRRVKTCGSELLAPLLASLQGLCPGGNERAALYCYPLPLRLWTEEVLPDRRQSPGFNAFTEELFWYGYGQGRTAFATEEALALALTPEELEVIRGSATLGLGGSFWEGAHGFWDIKDALEGAGGVPPDSGAVQELILNAVWEGRLSADSYAALLEAVQRSREKGTETQKLSRLAKMRWKAGPPVRGSWFALWDGLEGAQGVENLVEREEANRERAFLLLKRYGILSRELLLRETAAFRWSALLPALRRMELAGVVVAGHFIKGLSGIQFATPEIPQLLEEAADSQAIYAMNSLDPAFCGLLSGTGAERSAARRVCYRGQRLVASLIGKRLEVELGAEDPGLAQCLERLLLQKKALIEKVNGEDAAFSPFKDVLEGLGFVKDRRFMRRYP
jgi:ATP-dependent Lhr-like helicase